MPRALRPVLVALVLVLSPAVGLSACSTDSSSGATAAQADAQFATPTTNDFIPDDQNLSDCLGSLQRPNCGSDRKGGLHMYLAFGVLMLGMGVIGWRIAVGVRDRDRTLPPPSSTF